MEWRLARVAIVAAAAGLGLLAAHSGLLDRSGNASGASGKRERATLVRAIDGDTVEVQVGGHDETVRLIGIDTPESVRPGVPVECGAIAASDRMKAYQGAAVELVGDPTQDAVDRYGRLLRYVDLRRGPHPDLGERQIAAGAAEVYIYEGNPFERLSGYQAAASRARAAARGVWGDCAGDFHSAFRNGFRNRFRNGFRKVPAGTDLASDSDWPAGQSSPASMRVRGTPRKGKT